MPIAKKKNKKKTKKNPNNFEHLCIPFQNPKGFRAPKISFCNKRYASIKSELAFAKAVTTGMDETDGDNSTFAIAMRDLFKTSHNLFALRRILSNPDQYDFPSTSQNAVEMLRNWSSVKDYLGERWLLSTLMFTPEDTLAGQLKNIITLGGSTDDVLVYCRQGEFNCSEKHISPFLNVDHLKCFTFDPAEGYEDAETNVQGIKNGMTMVYMTGGGLLASSEFDPKTLYLLPGYQNTFHTSAGSDGIHVLIHSPDLAPQPDFEGIDVSPGTATTVGITSSETKRMEYPYGNCTMVNKERQLLRIAVQEKLGYAPPEEYGMVKSAYTPMVCRSLCVQRHVFEECGCFVPTESLPFFNSSLMCGFQINAHMHGDAAELDACLRNVTALTSETCMKILEKLLNDLKCVQRVRRSHDDRKEKGEKDFSCNCPTPCFDRHYNFVISDSQWPGPGPELDAAYEAIVGELVLPYFRSLNSSVFAGTIDYLADKENRVEIMKNFARVTFYVRSLRVEIVEEVADYTFLDLISDIGVDDSDQSPESSPIHFAAFVEKCECYWSCSWSRLNQIFGFLCHPCHHPFLTCHLPKSPHHSSSMAANGFALVAKCTPQFLENAFSNLMLYIFVQSAGHAACTCSHETMQ